MEIQNSRLILKQYSHPWISHLSYLLADPLSKTAIVVDPVRDADLYLRDAWQLGTPIRHVFLTQLHPDFEAGHLALRDRAGASVYLGAWARPDYDFTPVKDGDVLEFGQLRLQVVEMPGRTLEAIGLLIFDLRNSDRRPGALLSGDTLLVGDVGRPDPVSGAPMTAEQLAGMLYDSLHSKILPLPDRTVILPGHRSATLCGESGAESQVSSTIGVQRRVNFALQPMARAEFVRRLGDDRLEASEVPRGLMLPNRSGDFVWKRESRAGIRPLGLEEFLTLRNLGVQPVDLRDPADFAGAHLEGSLNVGLGPRSAAWVGRLLPRAERVMVVVDPGREGIAASLLKKAGLKVEGFLKGGMESLETRPGLLRSGRRVACLEAWASTPVLDVSLRTEGSFHSEAGSLAIPLDELPRRLRELPKHQDLVVVSEDGFLASIAASLLWKEGIVRAAVCVGGPKKAVVP